ncbi:hypothetical protein CBS147332_4070 [Penicillium roqueforti]|nr:hypothetical protein CBS147332_4070 [Penicillium roqueforti]KAI3108931.1 hypothetical protein CBS147331_5723 [Penicillium roqueforti]
MESNANQCRCPERYPQPWKAPLISLIGLAFVVLVLILVVRFHGQRALENYQRNYFEQKDEELGLKSLCLSLARTALSLQPGTAQSPATGEVDAGEQEAEEKKPTPPRLIIPYDNCASDDLPLVQNADSESVEFAVPPQKCRPAPQPGDVGTIPDIFHALKDKGSD